MGTGKIVQLRVAAANANAHQEANAATAAVNINTVRRFYNFKVAGGVFKSEIIGVVPG